MNEIVNKQVELHLLTFKDETPSDSVMYVVYLLGLTELYKQRFVVTWINILLFAWLIINVAFGMLGWWFAWFPVLTMAFMAMLYRMITQE